jgi:DNA polymerase-1
MVEVTRTLLIDGDLYAFVESLVVEKVIQWENKPDLFTLHADLDPAWANFKSLITRLKRELGADGVVVAFSDPDQRNWRVDLWPQYKAHRKKLGMRKPICYGPLVQRIKDTYKCVTFPRLEGDDVIGWLATNPAICPQEDKVIVSIDKDMHTIPNTAIYNTGTETLSPPHSEETADYHHMLQTLVGDSSDGYPGCPGVGKVSAPKVLAKDGEMWPEVLAAFQKKGLTEDDALMQARLARILRYEDFDVLKGEVKLWHPTAAC